MMTAVDPNTGEVLQIPGAQAAQAMDPVVLAMISRNEKLLERQDKLFVEVEFLRKENARLSSLYSEAKAQFHVLLAEAQAEFEPLKRDNNVEFPTKKGGSFSANTASMEAAAKAIGDSLTRRGIALRQPVIDHPADKDLSIIRTTLSFKGYEEHHDISIASAYSHSRKDADMKEFGADVSLVRKYALFAALGLIQETPERKRRPSEERDRSPQNQRYPAAARSSAPAHQPATRPAAVAPENSSASNGQAMVEHASLHDAKTLSELSAAMNALPREERGRYTAYFNQRRMELQKEARAA